MQTVIISRTLLTSQSRTASASSVQNDGDHERLGGHFVIDVTAIAATPSVVPTIDGFDAVSGKWYNILTGVAITATGTTVLKIYPGVTPAANVAVSDVLPPQWRIVMTHADADAITYSVSATMR